MAKIKILISVLALSRAALAQHEHRHSAEELVAPLELPHGRMGSGTGWVPDRTPMRAIHLMVGEWMIMLHGAASLGYDDQFGPRGGRKFLSTNWVMGMATRDVLGGELTLRTMLSLEPLTAGGRGVPLLLQSGETFEGQALHDTQHPHDLFMELAGMYRYSLGPKVGVEIYLAPSGEPALGPPAFMHRASSMSDPFPPIGHHWQDSTHISFGVLSAGVYGERVKLDASWFNGREPDESRWGIDLRVPDSFSARLSANPTDETSFQISYGALASPEELHPETSAQRFTASAMLSQALDDEGHLDLTLLWGRNVEDDHHGPEEVDRAQDSLLLEANVDLDGVNVPYGRLEYVAKSGHDLVLPGDPDRLFNVYSVALGFLRRFDPLGPIVPAIGVRANVAIVPPALEAAYGSRTPWGFFAYVMLMPPG